MKKYLMLVIVLFASTACAQVKQPLSENEQLNELKSVRDYYISEKLDVPANVTEGITNLERKLNITSQEPATAPAVPQTKQVCKKVKSKSGKYVTQCKTIKIRQKYEGKTVPTYKNK